MHENDYEPGHKHVEVRAGTQDILVDEVIPPLFSHRYS